MLPQAPKDRAADQPAGGSLLPGFLLPEDQLVPGRIHEWERQQLRVTAGCQRFNVPRLRTLAIDKIIMQSKDPDQAFARIRDEVLATQNAGGKVIVFDVLNPYDWNGAWATFAGMGITKARVTDFLASNFKIEYLGRVAEMPAWRIR